MASWRRCEQCRKVRSENEFAGAALICDVCATQPAKPVRAARSVAVTTRRVPPAAAADLAAAGSPDGMQSPAASSMPRQGVVGRGDPEVRGRRARLRALQELSELHADDFERLLLDARRAEGLS